MPCLTAALLLVVTMAGAARAAEKEKQWYDSASEKDGVDFLVADETGAVIVRWGSEETRTVKLTYANADR